MRWLEAHQNEDGGWGEDPRSYDDPEWIGRGPSTASQTAWALLALHAAGERSPALARGVQWLVCNQRADGGWDEPQYTGTGFPSRLLHQLPPLPADVPDDGARPLRGERARGRAAGGGGGRAPGVMLTGAEPTGVPAPRRVMARAGGENFPVASRVLPRDVRADLLAIYGFARLVDELGDSFDGDRLAALDWLEAELDRAYAGTRDAPAARAPAADAARRARCRASRSCG